MPIGRRPHIGEYATKTNAFCDCSQAPTAVKFGESRSAAAIVMRAVLLPVVSQDLITGLGQFGTMLLKASEDGEVALIHHQAAEALDIARACLLLFRCTASLLLGVGSGGHR
jgi:hypothetical protein